ncbi:hypothetical protein [Hydrogenophaga sp.]|uniref:hypothetical protein n=1 Tax=Hydrogenophaga sp. TaxID=1904254 RepID=UPI002719E3D8|nr:hypothetical protein [Hydrogenophaga sp.]MDO9434444.1 hypothetical protein [Hydrogenophaga sp.]
MPTVQGNAISQPIAPQSSAPARELPSNPATTGDVLAVKKIEEEQSVIADTIGQLDALASELEDLSKSLTRDAKIADLKQIRLGQLLTLEIGNLSLPQETRLLSAMFDTEREIYMLERNQSSATEFELGKLKEWNMEAGTLRSRLNDGGVTLDTQAITKRLDWLETAIGEVTAGLEGRQYWPQES